MAKLIERECNKCGVRCFSKKNCPCPYCPGTMCTIIRLIAKEQVAGVLCRNRNSKPDHAEICFIPNALLIKNLILRNDGKWSGTVSGSENIDLWTKEEWQEQYGKLPKKGSKEAIILKLSNVQ